MLVSSTILGAGDGVAPRWRLGSDGFVVKGLSIAVRRVDGVAGVRVFTMKSKDGLRRLRASPIIEGFSADFAAFDGLLAKPPLNFSIRAIY